MEREELRDFVEMLKVESNESLRNQLIGSESLRQDLDLRDMMIRREIVRRAKLN